MPKYVRHRDLISNTWGGLAEDGQQLLQGWSALEPEDGDQESSHNWKRAVWRRTLCFALMKGIAAQLAVGASICQAKGMGMSLDTVDGLEGREAERPQENMVDPMHTFPPRDEGLHPHPPQELPAGVGDPIAVCLLRDEGRVGQTLDREEMGMVILPIPDLASLLTECWPWDHVPIIRRHWETKVLREIVVQVVGTCDAEDKVMIQPIVHMNR